MEHTIFPSESSLCYLPISIDRITTSHPLPPIETSESISIQILLLVFPKYFSNVSPLSTLIATVLFSVYYLSKLLFTNLCPLHIRLYCCHGSISLKRQFLLFLSIFKIFAFGIRFRKGLIPWRSTQETNVLSFLYPSNHIHHHYPTNTYWFPILDLPPTPLLWSLLDITLGYSWKFSALWLV